MSNLNHPLWTIDWLRILSRLWIITSAVRCALICRSRIALRIAIAVAAIALLVAITITQHAAGQAQSQHEHGHQPPTVRSHLWASCQKRESSLDVEPR